MVDENDEPIIEHYEVLPAGIRPYDPRAADVFRRVAQMLTDRLPGLRVEHIGSTAVPGCAGKGYIDLLVPVRDDAEREAVKAILAELGFQHQTIKEAFPETRPMRTGVLVHDGERFRLHIHVVPAASEEIDALLLFRDRLRADPALVQAYVDRKREIVAAGITGSPHYAIAKGGFVQGAIRRGEEEE